MLAEVQFQDDAVLFLHKMVEGQVTNPFLLIGQEGTGRRFAAHQTTQELFCTGTRQPGCPCVDCLWLKQGIHPDLTELASVDGKDIGVEAVREMLEVVRTYPTRSNVRVFILDGADRLTSAAANALLKTLEEPPRTARFLLLAETAQRVIPTIRSRCGVLNFRPLPESFLLSSVEKFEADATKALVLARLGEGSVGRAIQYWGSGRLALRDTALEVLRLAQRSDVAGLFLTVDQLEKELPLMLRFLTTLLHDLIVLEVDADRIINLDKSEVLRSFKPPRGGWHALHQSLQEILHTQQNIRIQLAFHVKALFLQNAVEV